MHQKVGRFALVAILVATMMVTATADSGQNNDAGSGADAGNTRDTATKIQLATTYSARLRAGDVDWYAADVTNAAPTCVLARASANSPTYLALGVESPALRASAPIYVTSGQEGRAGIAGIAPLTATLRASPPTADANASKYDFNITTILAPTTGGDLGTSFDAGESTGSAMPTTPGCTMGTLRGLDLRDVYSLSIAANQVITYTLASQESGVTLTLLDSLGNIIGPTIARGESASVLTSTSGTYFLSSSRSTSVSDSGYAIGTIVGPEPSGCRPYCMS